MAFFLFDPKPLTDRLLAMRVGHLEWSQCHLSGVLPHLAVQVLCLVITLVAKVLRAAKHSGNLPCLSAKDLAYLLQQLQALPLLSVTFRFGCLDEIIARSVVGCLPSANVDRIANLLQGKTLGYINAATRTRTSLECRASVD